MNLHRALLATSLLYSFHLFSFSIQPEPLRTVHTPDSILNRKKHYPPVAVGNRARRATCTGVTWFHENYLAVLNLYGEKITTYQFDEEEKTFTLVQTITNKDGARLRHPENLAVSPDGTLLAVANAYPYVSIYSIDTTTHLISPTPIFSVSGRDLIHAARFSPDGTHLAYVSFDRNKSVCIYKILNNANGFNLKLVYQQANTYDARAKGIYFTQNGKYAVLTYARTVGNATRFGFKNYLVVQRFNQLQGTLGEIVCRVTGNFSTEDVALSHNNDAIILSDQGHDALYIYPFDSETGQIENSYTIIQSPEAQLSFPHGIGISSNGNYLAVANYGDDKFTLYQLNS